MSEYPDQVKLVLRNYPYKYRDYAEIAAIAVLAAGSQGKYWEMHDMVLENAPQFDRQSFGRYAEDLGMDRDKFEKELDNQDYKRIIEQDLQLADSLHLYGTPTLFINGRKVIGYRSIAYLKAIVEEELLNVSKK